MRTTAYVASALAVLLLGCNQATDSGKGETGKDPKKGAKPAAYAEMPKGIRIEGVDITGIPADREVEYLAKDNRGLWYCVDRPKGDKFSCDQFHVYIGFGDGMKEAELGEVHRYSDGGTTDMQCVLLDPNPEKTRIVDLHFPTSLNPDDKPSATYSMVPKGEQDLKIEEKRPLTQCRVEGGKIFAD